MEISNSNLPAFPPNAGWEHAEAKGLTKREFFAAMAMQGLLACNFSDYDIAHFPRGSVNKIDVLAKIARALADTTLAELEK